MDLKTYMQQLFQPSGDLDTGAAEVTRRWTKWLFDFTRNVMIVGVIKYVADKSGSWMLYAFYLIASGGLLAYIYSYMSYMQVWRFRPFSFLSNVGAAKILNWFADLALVMALFGLAQVAIIAAIREIAKVQG